MQSIVTVISMLTMLTPPQLSDAISPDASSSAQQVLSKAGSSQSLTDQECSQLEKALADPAQSGLWVQAARALDSNWAACDTDAVAINLSGTMGAPKTLAGLSFEQVRAFREILAVLRRAELANGVELNWLEASAQWKLCAPGELAAIWPYLQGPPARVAQARRNIVEHAWNAYFGRLASLQEPERLGCLQLIGQCGGSLSVARKSQIVGDLAKLYLREGKLAGDLPLSTVSPLVTALAAVSPREPAEMLAEWMSAGDSWKGKVPAAELASLGRTLAAYKGTAPSVAAGKAALVSHLWANYLGSEAALAQMSSRDLLALVAAIHPLLAAEQKQAMSRRLADRFAGSPEKASRTAIGDLLYAKGAMYGLWTAQELADVYAAWAGSNTSWKTCRPADLVGVAGPILGGKSEAIDRLRPLIGTFVWDRYLGPAANAKGVAAWEMFDLAQSTLAALSPQQVRELAGRLAKDFAQTPSGAARLTITQIARAAGAIEAANKGGMDFMAAWMTNNDCWKTAGVTEMSQLFF